LARRPGRTLDYRVAEIVEVITRKSTEEAEASHSLRYYARFLDTGERNLYKLVQRAQAAGFRFGLSVNYGRIGLVRLLAYAEAPVELPLPPRRVLRTLEGAYVVDSFIPLRCIREARDAVEAAGGRAFEASIEWGSRPALATLSFLHASPDAQVDEGLEERMAGLVRELMAQGPPPVLVGRRYPVGRLALAVLASAMENSMESVARIAARLGVPASKAQRKYYGLWQRRVVLGYSVACAPYCGESIALARVRHSDPVRLAYAVAVMPPVLWALVPRGEGGPGEVLVALTGGGSMVASALSVIRRLWGAVLDLTVAYEHRVNAEYPHQILGLPSGYCGLR